MRCYGSVKMEEPFRGERNDTSFSMEGTAAHELATWAIEQDKPCAAFIGRLATNGVEITEDMARDTQIYVDNVTVGIELAGECEAYCEMVVPISHMTGEDDAEGTSDRVIVYLENEHLVIRDLKFGKGEIVFAYWHDENGKQHPNEQLAMYAAGVIEKLALTHSFKTVSIGIEQPRINHTSEMTLTIDELEAFVEKVKKASSIVWEANEQFALIDKETWEDRYLSPGAKQCRWCKKKGTCSALRKFSLNAVMDDLVDLDDEPASERKVEAAIERAETSDDAYLDKLYPLLELIEDWGRAVLVEIEKRLLAGKEFKNAKLVIGKKGNRKWGDENAAEETMKSMRLKQDEMYKLSLKSPTDLEKLLAKESPRKWKRLSELVTQSDGKPSVAPISDKREAYKPPEVNLDFGDEDGSDLV